jgi:aminoacyl tRNA synthase complex-interacting multifunctional protein 1
LLEPPPNSKPGDRVYFEGAEFESELPCIFEYFRAIDDKKNSDATPVPQLNPKKKVFETIQPGG